MLRNVILLIAVAFCFLAQAGPSMAHVAQSKPIAMMSYVPNSEIRSTPGHEKGCRSESGCCNVMCAPCYLSLTAQQSRFAGLVARSSRLIQPRQDCLRSIILGRDPPIPRSSTL